VPRRRRVRFPLGCSRVGVRIGPDERTATPVGAAVGDAFSRLCRWVIPARPAPGSKQPDLAALAAKDGISVGDINSGGRDLSNCAL
jgi:hypothetical protein